MATSTLPNELKQAILKAVEPYPIPTGQKYGYGTAGVSDVSIAILGLVLTELVPNESVRSLLSSSTPS